MLAFWCILMEICVNTDSTNDVWTIKSATVETHFNNVVSLLYFVEKIPKTKSHCPDFVFEFKTVGGTILTIAYTRLSP